MPDKVKDFVIYHLTESLVGALAEADGDEIASQRLHARAKLRLVTMSDMELQELAKLVAYPPNRRVETIYNELMGQIEEIKQMANEWTKEFVGNTSVCPKNTDNYKILIIEDDRFLSIELVSTFKRSGFIVAEIPDCSQAFTTIDEFKPDLILMETILPDRDGFEACYEIRQRFNIPVILLGQDTSNQAWDKFMKADADNYETKPLSFSVLVAKANAILRRTRRAI
jgi:PleD family two-component response regulator